jgi:predicted negative regulator of RcsB-dependent stress response
MQDILFTPEGRAFSKALATVSHLDKAVERAKRNLHLSKQRMRQSPHEYWRSRIAEYSAEVARLEADREEARQAYEQAQAALSVVRESMQVAA